MNLLCPNCQKMLTIDEQYAGQMMRCPLCSGTFLVPSLAPAHVAAGSTPGPEPAPTYGFAGSSSSPPRTELPETVVVEKATSQPTPEPTPPAPPSGYTRTHVLRLNAEILPWIAPVCLALIFILLFFNWDGLYPGGYGVYTQSAWGSAFASFSADPVGEKVLQAGQPLRDNLHASWVLILFLLVFLPLLVLAVASVVVPRLQLKLPPAVQQLMPWKSAIIAGLAALALVLLLFQLLLGLGLENAAARMVDNQFTDQAAAAQTPEDHQTLAIEKGRALDGYSPGRGFGLRMTVILSLLAIAGAGLDFWMERRGNRPRPRLDVSW